MIVQHYYDSGWVDISDYVIHSSDLPIFERNMNYELIVSDMDIDISFIYPNTISKGEKIRFYSTATVYHDFEITDIQYNHTDRLKELTCKQTLYKLQDPLVKYGPLLDVVVNQSNPDLYKLVDNTGYGNISLLWSISSMFQEQGLTLDTGSVVSHVVGTFEHVDYTGADANVTGEDLKIDLSMYFNIGPSKKYFRLADKLNDQRLTYFEYISEICAHFGWALVDKADDNYKLVPMVDKSSFTVTDSILIDKEQQDNEKDETTGEYKLMAGHRNYYQITTDTDFDEVTDLRYYGDSGGYTHNIPNSMFFMIKDNAVGSSAGDVVTYTITYPPPIGDFQASLMWFMYSSGSTSYGCAYQNHIDAETKNNTKYTYTLEVTGSQAESNNILSQYIDIQNRTSIIETIVYT